MTATSILDLSWIEVEHLVSYKTGEPVVVVRALSPRARMLGQMPPADARQIAAHLAEAAALPFVPPAVPE